MVTVEEFNENHRRFVESYQRLMCKNAGIPERILTVEPPKCKPCEGSGIVYTRLRGMLMHMICPKCGGSGRI